MGEGGWGKDVVVVLGVEHHGVDVAAGEPTDRIGVVPKAEGDRIGAVLVEVPGEDVHCSVAVDLAVGTDSRGLDVGDVGVEPVGGDDSAPHPGDHCCSRTA